MPRIQALNCSKTLATHVAVGMGAASFWRGAWYVLDDHLFPEDAVASSLSSLGLGVAGMAASQGLVARAERLAERVSSLAATKGGGSGGARSIRPLALKTARVGALYTVAVSCVLVWRGTWLGWDCLYEYLHPPTVSTSSKRRTDEEGNHAHHHHHYHHHHVATTVPVKSTDPGHATNSGLLSHFVALGLLLGTGLFASVLAPPAAVSVIRDLAVKTGQKPVSGPAQLVVSRLFGGGSGAATASRTTTSPPLVVSAAGARPLTTTSSSSATKFRRHFKGEPLFPK